MDWFVLLIEGLKFIVPALVVFGVCYFTMQKLIESDYDRKMIEFRHQNKDKMLPAKIQAYERLTLYLERINPSNLLIRLNQPGISAGAFKLQLQNAINEEFNHNLAQQLYVSPQAWKFIRIVKEQVMALINESYAQCGPNSSGPDLSKAILENMIAKDDFPVDKAIDFLKKEFKLIFDF